MSNKPDEKDGQEPLDVQIIRAINASELPLIIAVRRDGSYLWELLEDDQSNQQGPGGHASTLAQTLVDAFTHLLERQHRD